MIVFDGIIYKLQNGGGISVYFTEIIKGLSKKEEVTLLHYGVFPKELEACKIKFVRAKWRLFERIRRPQIDVKLDFFFLLITGYITQKL